jgi:hypothetical protein
MKIVEVFPKRRSRPIPRTVTLRVVDAAAEVPSLLLSSSEATIQVDIDYPLVVE